MEPAPIPPDEERRLDTVRNLHILDTPSESRFDSITRIATLLFHAPISTISILDRNREWFKSVCGLDQREGERAISFCGHALEANEVFIVPDTTRDSRFQDNPMVIGKPFVRFYAGVPLFSTDGTRIGAFCIKDTTPRQFGDQETLLLKSLAHWAELEINNNTLSILLDTVKKQSVELDSFFELSESVMGIANASGYLTRVNRKFRELLGYSDADLKAKPFLNLIHPDDVQKTAEQVKTVLQGAPTVGFTIRLRKKNDSYVWLQWDATAYDGYLYGVGRDISQEIEQKNKELRYELILHYAHDAIIAKDLNGLISYWNDSAERIFGYSSQEMLGRSIMQIIPTEKQTDYQIIMDAIRQGTVVDNFETSIQTKDGRLLTVLLSVAPIHDYRDTIVGATVIAQDITKRKEEEQRLRDSFAELNRINQAMVDRELRMIELKQRIKEMETQLSTSEPT